MTCPKPEMPEPFFVHGHWVMNLCICVTTGRTGEFSALMVDSVPDLHVTGAPAQCFPLYLYDMVET